MLPEQTLWNYFDKIGIDFRKTRAELIKKHGHRNCGWTNDLDYCEIDSGSPFIEGLAHPIVFQYQPFEYLQEWPGSFFGYSKDRTNKGKKYGNV